MHISFIGGGNMARAIIGGLKINGFDMQNITVIEPTAEKRTQLIADFDVQTAVEYSSVPSENMIDEVILLAVKPQQLHDVCQQIAPLLTSQLVISIAAGVRSADISRWLNAHSSIVRVMPNTPAQIQAGVSALFALPQVKTAQREQAAKILSAVGLILWLDDESKMDAITAISGSGPAYVFYLIEALSDAAVALGLPVDHARLLALETFAGASMLAKHSTEDVKTLRAQVTSKGGTTEQGILALEAANIKNAMLQAAMAAAEKSRALGDTLAQ
ncbi:MAG: pyrroline-5-carboxylate reductase [Methylophilaceae bacterium]